MIQQTQRKAVLFPNLNGVRFIAAFMVIVHHIEQLKGIYDLPSCYFTSNAVRAIGGLGVTLFFVLSGFLITYLLLVEKNDFKTIALKEFYTRRILRIWPLYYLVVLLAFFVIPQFIPWLRIPQYHSLLAQDFTHKLMLYLFFVPNIAFVTTDVVPYASQAWSIGVEEQFYLLWPVIIKYVTRPVPALCAVIAFFIAAHAVLQPFILAGGPESTALLLEQLLYYTRIECMAIGGISAVLLFQQSRIIPFLYSRTVQSAAYCISGILILYGIKFPLLYDIPYAIIFAIIILNLAANKNTIVNINWRILDYLGKISYGLYMFHALSIIIAINLAVKTFNIIDANNFTLVDNMLIYILSIMVTIAMSAASYEFFEKRFLKLKLRFTKIISGDNVQAAENTGSSSDN